MNETINYLKNVYNFNYNFRFNDGKELKFNIQLDKVSLGMIPKTQLGYPEWIILGHRKCPICPFDEKNVNYCPIAKNLVEVIDSFKGMNPDEDIELFINTETRNYFKKTTVKEGMSSLIGIYMVTGGCPILDKLRPMVRFHLPFADHEETKYRAITMYLMAQFLLYKQGKIPDWDLKYLFSIYKNVRIVNRSFHERLAESPLKKASIEALMKLDCFAGQVSDTIVDKDTMSNMSELFNAYM
ncbi:MAG: hypothetical protein JW871_04760 [Endomicrobiales bacterium]|nr:hypothetical protein [Endomicrobiales bacterium]